MRTVRTSLRHVSRTKRFAPDASEPLSNIYYTRLEFGMGSLEHFLGWYIAIDGQPRSGLVSIMGIAFRRLPPVSGGPPDLRLLTVGPFGALYTNTKNGLA